jgi:hypothetical protein
MSQSDNVFDVFDASPGPPVYWDRVDEFLRDVHPDSTANRPWMSQDQHHHPLEGDGENAIDAPDVSGPADTQGVYGQLVARVPVSSPELLVSKSLTYKSTNRQRA